jgi:hypothetical protein
LIVIDEIFAKDGNDSAAIHRSINRNNVINSRREVILKIKAVSAVCEIPSDRDCEGNIICARVARARVALQTPLSLFRSAGLWLTRASDLWSAGNVAGLYDVLVRSELANWVWELVAGFKS